ncbi:hypothetical protein BGZ83_004805 [Gryganskiella cystojenkinii]|nr:hypothetical protein BGZ83_004805 [Gryganskiella cystojenkinii]
MNGSRGLVMQPLGSGGPTVMRSNSVMTPLANPAGNILQPSPAYPRAQYQPYADQRSSFQQDQDHRLYEQYEQQAHYYRDNSPKADPQPQQHQPQVQPWHGLPQASYRHSTYYGVYAGSPQMPRQQQPMQQLHPQRSLNLGPINQNRYPIPRDQLPTAPTPSAISAAQHEPTYLEQSARPIGGVNIAGSGNNSFSMDTLITPDSAISRDSFVASNSNRNSVYSMHSLSSPVIPDRIQRPLSAVIEPQGQYPRSPRMNHILGGNNNLARTGSDPHWNSSFNMVQSQTRPKPTQALAYSRQVTLSTIPSNEDVPPIPGKMTSKTGKVRIQLTFDRPFFNAGGELSGRLEVQCSSSRSVMFADMIIELLGYEALTKDHLAPKIFHKTVLRLQDVRHPSQAVQENIEPDGEGYWLARKGRTIFPFRLNVQDTLPNSYDSKLGQVRYVASAIATMKANQHKEVVNHSREVFIYETWTTDDITQARRKSVKADTSKRLFMGGEGSLEMYAELTRTMVSSGGIVYVNVGVKNLTKKKIMGIKLSLWRHIAASHSRASISSQSSVTGIREQDSVKNYSEIIYKGEDYAFDSDDPRIVVLPVYIPSGVYSLRNTSYLHVQFFVQVSLMASMSKALAVELPIYITHASSWSDPPPRIPKDFTFPLHEDDPVKKNKTGVFSKKKPGTCTITAQPNGSATSVNSPMKSGTNGSTTSISAPTSKSSTPTPRASDSFNMDSNGSRPITHRSPLKDPDSPTSVLDFSQAGSLFVVNPDAGSLNGSDTSSVMKQPLATRSTPKPGVLSMDESFSPPPSSSPVDRSTPLMPADQGLITIDGLNKAPLKYESVFEEEQDFDMSRAVGTSVAQASPSPSKKEEKSKHGKMGLRKTLAKLSISIPNHSIGGSCSNANKVSRLSPHAQPTTPRSVKSLSMISSDDPTSAGSQSPGGGSRPLSRQSSTSSLGSFKSMFERHARNPSGGSNQVMTASPRPISPDSKYADSEIGSAVPLSFSSHSDLSSAANSGTSSPAHWSGSLSGDGRDDQTPRERHHDLGHLSMTPAIPDVRLHQGTPLMEGMDRDGYFETNNASRPSTPKLYGHRIDTVESSPVTPSSQGQPWEMPRSFSSSSLASSVLEPMEPTTSQSARSIRDQFYYGDAALVHNVSNGSNDNRLSEPEPVTDGGLNVRERQPSQQDIFDRVTQDDEVIGNTLERQLRRQEEEQQQQLQRNQEFTEQQERERQIHLIHDHQRHLQEQYRKEEQYIMQQERQEPEQQGQGQQRLQPGPLEYKTSSLVAQLSDLTIEQQVLTPQLLDIGYSSMPPSVHTSPSQMHTPISGFNLTPEHTVSDRYQAADEFPLQSRGSASQHSSRPHSRQSSTHTHTPHIPITSNPRLHSPLQHEQDRQQSQYFDTVQPTQVSSMQSGGEVEFTSGYSALPPVSERDHDVSHDQVLGFQSVHQIRAQDQQQRYSPEIYSTPMLIQDSASMGDTGGIQPIPGTVSTLAPTLSFDTTPYHTDNQDSSPGDVLAQQTTPVGLSLMGQPFAPPLESSVLYSEQDNILQGGHYVSGLQPMQFSPHPSRSNSRQGSPKQWHHDVSEQVLQQAPMVQPYDQRESDVNIHGNSYTRDQEYQQQQLQEQSLSYPPELDPVSKQLQQGVIIPIEQPVPIIPYETHPLQGSIYMDDAREVPYQPRTQYVPASTSALNNDSRSVALSTVENVLGLSSSQFYTNTADLAFLPASEVFPVNDQILSSTSIPEHSWNQPSSPPLPVKEADMLPMDRIDASIPAFQQHNPYMTNNVPVSLTDRSGSVHSEVPPTPILHHQEAVPMPSMTPGDSEEEETTTRSSNYRFSGSSQGSTYKMSPLAYEGNVMTANSASPPLLSGGGVVLSMASLNSAVDDIYRDEGPGARVLPVPPRAEGDDIQADE